MIHMLVGLNVAVLLVLIGILVKMQQKHFSFSKRVFAGLGFGILLGIAMQVIYGADSNGERVCSIIDDDCYSACYGFHYSIDYKS